MKILVGCEFTRTVASAFERAGHLAMSCDLDQAIAPGPHYRGDIMQLLDAGHDWDLAILHPDCTHMAVCGNRYHAGTQERDEAVEWTLRLWEKATSMIERVCLENPASVIFPAIRDRGADVQYIQPHEHGHPEQKKTGLALHNLPRLEPTWDVSDIMATLPKKECDGVSMGYARPNRTGDNMSEYDSIDMDYAKMDAYEGGKKDGFFAGACFGFLMGALVMGLLVSLS